MNLSEWRAKQSETMTLPSGLEVKLRRASLVDLLANGRIPNTLLGQVNEMAQGATEIKIEELPGYVDALNVVVAAVIVDPPVAEQADDTHMRIDELPIEDRMMIFGWANQGAAAVKPFRGKPDGDVGAVQPGDGVRAEAEQDPGD